MTLAAPGYPNTKRIPEVLAQRKIPSLDGLRALAVLFVICNHAQVPYIPEGRGVLTFFVMSGFLITWMLLNEANKYGSVSVPRFYMRRVLRILPAFYVYLVVQFLAQLAIKGRPSQTMIGDYLSALTCTSNYRFALMPHIDHAVWHSWALSTEEQFYLLWPLLLVVFLKDLRKLMQVLIAIIAGIDVYRMVLFFQFHISDKWLNFTFDCRVDHLLVGCLLAVLLKGGVLQSFWNWATATVWPSIAIFALIMGSIVLSFQYQYPYRYAVGYVIDPLLTAVFVLQVMVLGNTWAWGWLNWSVTRGLGRISYSVFLYHMLAFHFVTLLVGSRSLWILVPATILGASAIGAVSYHVVERRFLRWKRHFGGRGEEPAVPLPASVAAG
jgi:peptidoglycan/LPS O-acetylase OafA/YrhL